MSRGFPGGASGKEPACQCRRRKRCQFNPWARKIPWRRAWQPTPVFLPGRSHGQRSLEDYSPWGPKTVGQDWSNLAYIYKCQVTTIWVRKFCIVIKNFLYLPLFHLKWNCIHFPMLQNIRELTFFFLDPLCSGAQFCYYRILFNPYNILWGSQITATIF